MCNPRKSTACRPQRNRILAVLLLDTASDSLPTRLAFQFFQVKNTFSEVLVSYYIIMFLLCFCFIWFYLNLHNMSWHHIFLSFLEGWKRKWTYHPVRFIIGWQSPDSSPRSNQYTTVLPTLPPQIHPEKHLASAGGATLKQPKNIQRM